MIVTRRIRVHGVDYVVSHSDSGFYIEHNGYKCCAAIDLVTAHRTYNETNELIDVPI